MEESLTIGTNAEVLAILAQLLVLPHILVSAQMTGIRSVYRLGPEGRKEAVEKLVEHADIPNTSVGKEETDT